MNLNWSFGSQGFPDRDWIPLERRCPEDVFEANTIKSPLSLWSKINVSVVNGESSESVF